MKFKFAVLFAALVFTLSCESLNPVTIYLIGDSTMADKPTEGNPERGWGQLLPEFFTQKARIRNHAVNGRSSKSFIDEGRWEKVVDSLKAGDFVIIQFGHNDEKIQDSTRYTDPAGSYRQNLEKFIQETRGKSAFPILCTPIMRRRFDETGRFYDTHSDYPEAVRQVAGKLVVPLIDMHQMSESLIISHGVEDSKKIFLFIEPGEYQSFPQGKEDNTHFSEYGARAMAGLFAEEIKELKLPLENFLK